MSFSLKKLEKYSYNKKKQPIKYDNVISLPTIERASCVTYYDNQLFVGFLILTVKDKLLAILLLVQETLREQLLAIKLRQ